jgi:hypothetical protein
MKQLTAKEEAKKLVDKFYLVENDQKLNMMDKSESKQCALIALEGRMEELCILPYGMEYLDRLAYLEEIKEEINKL